MTTLASMECVKGNPREGSNNHNYEARRGGQPWSPILKIETLIDGGESIHR